jgi:bifunctional non-homologous end joining protein LigD
MERAECMGVDEPLKEYSQKRSFDETPEPRPAAEETGLSRFVVQEHNASHLHWDFRLELDGVLKSWAVPKGVPQAPGVRRLAVQTEDHPVSYIDFEGTIAPGQYGAGTVKIWDKGTFSLEKRTEKEYLFALHGERLSGNYALIHTNGKQWLLLKRK